MGNWAKGHLKPKNAFNPIAGMKDLSARAKDDITPDAPDMSETTEEKALRSRQVEQLARLDEDENRRIKALFRGRSGTRMFRGAGSTRSGSAGSGGSAAASGASGGSSGTGAARGASPARGGRTP